MQDHDRIGGGVMRAAMYVLGRLFGDINSVKRGTVHKRLVNKSIGRYIVSRLWWR